MLWIIRVRRADPVTQLLPCLLAVFLAGILSACQPGFEPGWQALELVIPERPEVWRGIPMLEYRLRWVDSDGRQQVGPYATGGAFWVRLPRGRLCPVFLDVRARFSLAEPGFALKPCGTLYPLDPQAASGRCWPGWEKGYACAVATALGREGLGPEDFDLRRLAEVVAAGGDPWRVPVEAVAPALSQGRFRAEHFSPSPTFPIRLPPGQWFPESPFVLLSADGESTDGETKCAYLAPGIHRFVGLFGWIMVQVDEEGGFQWAGGSG